MRYVLYLAFFLSGAAGLIYESIWARYLGLFVGHTAYAQVIVLTIFLGGLSLGAILVGRRSEKIRRPLFWYAGAELGVGLFGLFFHDLFLALQGFAYSSVFPALGESPLLTPVKWGLVGALILPPSILLGTTFPFISAGLLRLAPGCSGRVLSMLYFTNSSGAAMGALVAGFIWLEWFGLPGTVQKAALLNMAAGFLAWGVDRAFRGREVGGGQGPLEPSTGPGQTHGIGRAALWRLLLVLSFGTALASFIYEIAWIRMLSLVLGSATHSFELMLSAFILGLALGALWMKGRADGIRDPLQALGWIQWIMGAGALATLSLYLASFQWTAELLSALNPTPSGYGLFNLARYGMALLVMLPATFCAGTTLPLITRTLLSAGSGERAVGWVYGVNTLGSILGVVLAALVLMPVIGLKGLLILGGGLDMALGVFLLSLRNRGAGEVESSGGPGLARGRRGVLVAAVGASVVILVTLVGVDMDRSLLTSGVFRRGRFSSPETEVRFYRDGRTATVSAEWRPPGHVTISTNGKPDATLSAGWLAGRGGEGEPSEPGTLELDEPTQVLSALLTLAHYPRARTAVVVGHGSGLSSHMLLGSPHLETLTTVEIEPRMLEGSRIFLPATRRVFSDPRSRFVIDDAKSFLARAGTPADLILSEPSNPWVSGVSSLFTQEFYRTVRDRLAPGGVFGQWLHLYEIDDGLILSVLAALHRSFESYRVFLVHRSDMLIVARASGELPPPDWSVFDHPAIREDLAHTFPFHGELLDASLFLDGEGLAPLLESWERPNSDFFPVLDLGAERARFYQTPATGFLESAGGPFDLADAFRQEELSTGDATFSPVPQIPMGRALALRNRIKRVLDGRSEELPFMVSEPRGEEEGDLELDQALFRLQRAEALLAMREPPVDWVGWLQEVLEGVGWTSATGWKVLDSGFLPRIRERSLDLAAPDGVLAALAFLEALGSRDWEGILAPSAVLADEIEEGRRWINPAVVLDAGVAARILTGGGATAGAFFDRLEPLSGRAVWDFRSRLLKAHLDRAASLR